MTARVTYTGARGSAMTLQIRIAIQRITLAAALLPLAITTLAQSKFIAHGRVKIEGGGFDGARVVVYKNGTKERTITDGLAKFTLDLDLNANYIVSFEKAGYVSKKISFDTRVPADAAANGFTPFDFAVSLFKQYDDVNTVVFNQPVGMIRYDNAAGDFDYDTDYTKSIQSQLQEAAAQVEQKQKQEAQAAAEAEKRKTEEVKAQAKAEAEAKKQAAAAEAAAIKVKAEAEKTAAEAERRRAEEARTAAATQEKREAEEAKAAAEAAKQAKSVAKAEPKPEPKAEPKPIPPAPAPQRSMLASEPRSGEDGRRTQEPTIAEEPSRVAPARANEHQDLRPEPVADLPEVVRTEDLIVEAGKVTTVVKLEVAGRLTEYRRVFHKWGSVFYFKDGQPCTALIYESEALPQERLAGATPRAKHE